MLAISGASSRQPGVLKTYTASSDRGEGLDFSPGQFSLHCLVGGRLGTVCPLAPSSAAPSSAVDGSFRRMLQQWLLPRLTLVGAPRRRPQAGRAALPLTPGAGAADPPPARPVIDII